MGGAAFGVFAFGGFAAGLVSMGGLALAVLFSWGGFAVAIAGLAFAGFALGLVACGGFACGITAVGGLACGLWVPHAGKGFSYFTSQNVPDYLRYFDTFLARPDTFSVLSLVLVLGMLVPLLLIQLLMTRKEHLRVKRADPKLVE